MKEIIRKYRKEIEEIDKRMPWKQIAELYLFNKEPDNWLFTVITEYKLLIREVQGMEEYPDKWKGMENHPQTHIDALKQLLEVKE